MRAIRVRDDAGRSLSWEQVPEPELGHDEVLLRIHATAVNRADLLQREGKYPPPPGAPEYLGLEAAGIIERAGPGAGPWQAGDRAACLLAGGGYAERVAVHRDLLLPIPNSLSLAQAASLPEAFATAWLNLVIEGELKSGETALIHAGASGVGLAAIQVAKLRGAQVVTTVGTAVKAQRVRELGADDVIVHAKENVTERLKHLGAQRVPGGIDVALDCLGGEELEHHLPLMNVGGRWIVIGLMRGRYVALDLRPILSRRLRVIGSTLRARPLSEKARVLRELRAEVWPALGTGTVRPVIHAEFPITEVEEAHAVVQRNENIGKVVLTVP
ncbi:MAG: NAD(P)H-quinone oxidoreductase [Candidatus Eisenbacteria bacterium]|nr:NAD(P)H-quinone oxidoreductase [Candidatus Eisenbacteria bacterium]